MRQADYGDRVNPRQGEIDREIPLRARLSSRNEINTFYLSDEIICRVTTTRMIYGR